MLHALHEELVLVLVYGLDEFRRNFRVVGRLIPDPSVESHEYLDSVDDVRLFIEFLYGCRQF